MNDMETAWLYYGIGVGVFGGAWLMAGLFLAISNLTANRAYQAVTLRWVQIGLLIIVVATLGLTVKVFTPLVQASTVEKPADHAKLPELDFTAWHALPVQHDGRTKPFETACNEIVRHITGRTRFEKEGGFKGHDPVGLVLTWMLTGGAGAGSGYTNWDEYPFILCDYEALREKIYTDKLGDKSLLTKEHRHGKYVSPSDLRSSASFQQFLEEVSALHDKWGDKYTHHMSPVQRKAEEVAGRLRSYERVARSRVPQAAAAAMTPRWADQTALHMNPLMGLATPAHLWWTTRFQTIEIGRLARVLEEDPIHLVALDRVKDSAWFSIGQIYAVLEEESRWKEILRDRLSRTPQLYVSPERCKDLAAFQQQVKDGTAQKTLDELAELLPRRSDEAVAAFRERYAGQDHAAEHIVAQDPILDSLSVEEKRKLIDRLSSVHSQRGEGIYIPVLANILRETFDERDQKLLEEVENQVRSARAQGYYPADERFRMLHLNYLEGRFPDVYREILKWQPCPAEKAKEVVGVWDRLRRAYRSGDNATFENASRLFLDKVHQVSDRTLAEGLAQHHESLKPAVQKMVAASNSSDTERFDSAREEFLQAARGVGEAVAPYPGTSSIPLEMRFNAVQPFMWAWILMLAAMLLFCISLMWDSKIPYSLAFVAYIASLGFQIFGYYARVALSGRAPVSNMYETVVWVSSMSAVFALILELVYRKKVIALGGAMVATLGLVLADQLPNVLDPNIRPLVPVLRSNFWLTIHVLTIVSSYAGGTLAWGLGNITLALLIFGRPSREQLKTLSTYTYRAIQIAVLLLAAGTFLGAWWAADSWGRWWGWDPKEVWALIALVSYVIPLHMRYIGWVKDFGLAVCAVVCYSSIVMAWYGVNFVLGAGLHSYGFGGGGPWWVFWAGMLNLVWVLVAGMIYLRRQLPAQVSVRVAEETAAVS